MKKILIRVESHKKAGLGGMETRIRDFIEKNKNKFKFEILSNINIQKIYKNFHFIKSNYFSFLGIIKDIFSFRNYNIIESNGHRDNIIAILNYLLFLPIYKFKGIKLFIVIHGILGFSSNKGLNKIIYNFIFFIGIIICNKIIFVSKETNLFLINEFPTLKRKIYKKGKIIPNYIKIFNPRKNNISRIKKALLISRIDLNKKPGIKKAINFCDKNNILLDIYGGGNELENLKNKYPKINFKGEINNKDILYENYDLIFGMGRALLEGVGSNLPGILIGYNDIISEISLSNIDTIAISNFSGRGIQPKNEKKIFENIKKLLLNGKYKEVSSLIQKKYKIDNFIAYW